MNYLSILAQAAEPIREDVEVVPIDFIWEQITALSWLQAVLAISFGIVYLLYGWRIFKILVIISFGLLGMFAGIYTSQLASISEVWGGVIGLVALAVLAVPLMKWAVCILGAVAGGVLTAGIWYAFELPQMYIWAGGAVGAVAGGMISFIVLKAAVMLFTSLGGSVITVVGLLALLHIYETEMEVPPTTHIHDLVFDQNWFLPLALIIPTIIGIATQNKFIQHSHKWEL
jgi:hypothetical protein